MNNNDKVTSHQPSLKKNIAYNLIKTFSGIIFPLITFPYASRVLQPENIGKYNFGAAYVSYFSLIASLGIATYAIRECSKFREDKEQLSRVSSEIFSINIFTTLMAYAVLFIILFLFPKLNPYRRLITIQCFQIIFSTLGADWINSAMEDFRYITIRTVIFQVISLVLMLIFVRETGDYIKYAAITLVSSSGGNIANIFYRKRFCKIRFTTHIQWKKRLKPIMMLFALLLSQTIFSNCDITMIGIIKGDYQVGLYSTATKIYNMYGSLIASVMYVILPRLSGYFAEQDYASINSVLKKNIELQIMTGLPGLVGIAVMSQEVLWIIGGDKYIPAYPSLIILMVALFVILIGGNFIGNDIMIPSGEEDYFTVVTIVATIVNVVLNFAVIPLIGATGAALTTLLANLIILFMLLPHVDQRINIGSIRSIFAAPVTGSVLVAVWCILVRYLIHNHLITLLIGIIGGAAIYCIVLFIMRYDLFIETIESVKARLRK